MVDTPNGGPENRRGPIGYVISMNEADLYRNWSAATTEQVVAELDGLAGSAAVEHGSACLEHLAFLLGQRCAQARAVVVDLTPHEQNPDDQVSTVAVLAHPEPPDTTLWEAAGPPDACASSMLAR